MAHHLIKELILTTRILLADEQPAIRSSLQAVVACYDDLELVGEAEDGATAVKLCGETRPDVVVMDMMMPEMNGISATRLIRKHYPEVKVLALTSYPEDYSAQHVLEAGAVGYLLKNVSADELVTAIRAAHQGHSTIYA
jgi:NarL family two-component system response regulator LiaR